MRIGGVDMTVVVGVIVGVVMIVVVGMRVEMPVTVAVVVPLAMRRQVAHMTVRLGQGLALQAAKPRAERIAKCAIGHVGPRR